MWVFMDKHENQRVRLTKKLFRDSLIALLRKKKIYQITVSELCAAAELNRSSFYKHYGNVYDVLAELEEDFLAQILHDGYQYVRSDVRLCIK